MIERLDFSAFDASYRTDDRGRPATPPTRMAALIMYAILCGTVSMRSIARDMKVRADLVFLAGGTSVDHSTFSVFRDRRAAALTELFVQTVFLCPEGKTLRFGNERAIGDIRYRRYVVHGCGDRRLRAGCAGPDASRVATARADDYRDVDVKYLHDRRSGNRQRRPSDPDVLAMRRKLDTPEGRRIYARRFPIAEGVFATIKQR